VNVAGLREARDLLVPVGPALRERGRRGRRQADRDRQPHPNRRPHGIARLATRP
jgi:hypothetical protein